MLAAGGRRALGEGVVWHSQELARGEGAAEEARFSRNNRRRVKHKCCVAPPPSRVNADTRINDLDFQVWTKHHKNARRHKARVPEVRSP